MVNAYKPMTNDIMRKNFINDFPGIKGEGGSGFWGVFKKKKTNKLEVALPAIPTSSCKRAYSIGGFSLNKDFELAGAVAVFAKAKDAKSKRELQFAFEEWKDKMVEEDQEAADTEEDEDMDAAYNEEEEEHQPSEDEEEDRLVDDDDDEEEIQSDADVKDDDEGKKQGILTVIEIGVFGKSYENEAGMARIEKLEKELGIFKPGMIITERILNIQEGANKWF